MCELACKSSKSVDVHLVNSYTIALANRNGEYRELLCGSAVNLPDGRPLSVVTRRSAEPLHQVRGPGLFDEVMNIGRKSGIRHFLLGSDEETLTKLKTELERRYPGVQIVGAYSPPFRPLTNEEYEVQDRAIHDSNAQIVWVGLGTPKQDFEAQRVARSQSVVAIAVGAAFDFVAGTKAEAPTWVRRIGFEWLFRLACEPRRLWKRYLFGNAEFMFAVAKDMRSS